jgi:hypothetical protein
MIGVVRIWNYPKFANHVKYGTLSRMNYKWTTGFAYAVPNLIRHFPNIGGSNATLIEYSENNPPYELPKVWFPTSSNKVS